MALIVVTVVAAVVIEIANPGGTEAALESVEDAADNAGDWAEGVADDVESWAEDVAGSVENALGD